jgi:hypothetical protein
LAIGSNPSAVQFSRARILRPIPVRSFGRQRSRSGRRARAIGSTTLLAGVVKPMKTVPASLAGGERILLPAAFWSPRGYEAPAGKLPAFIKPSPLPRAWAGRLRIAAACPRPDRAGRP